MSLDDKVRDACHRIEELYYETGGKCYVSFSGGKDSTVLLALIKLCEEVYTIPPNAIPAVFANTGIELGITVDFIKWVKENYYPNVVIIRPQVSFDWVLKNKGKPMVSKLKSEYLGRYHAGNKSRSVMQNMVYGVTNSGNRTWKLKLADKDMHMLHDDFPIRISKECCEYLKKKPFKKFVHDNGFGGQMTGLRSDEGGARALNVMARVLDEKAKICTTVDKKGFIKKTPIIDWSDDDLEEFIKKYDVPLSSAYTKFDFNRTGCMACPYSSKWLAGSLEYLYYHEPNRYKASMHWLKDVYIAQDVRLPFDQAYEAEREREWRTKYEPMRQEMLRKYRPNSRLIKDGEQSSIFDYLEEGEHA